MPPLDRLHRACRALVHRGAPRSRRRRQRLSLVSVLLPHRAAGALLDEAIASILAQEAVDLELVTIDDGAPGSDDAAIVARHASRDRRVRAIASGGVGIAGALTVGLAAARGELIARMDADDVSHPRRLAAQLGLLASDARLGAVGALVEGFPDEAVGDGLRAYIAWQNSLVTPADHARDLFVEAPLCHPSVVLRREALDAVGGWRDAPWAEDYDLWLRLDAAGWALAKVPELLFRWRHHGARATFTNPIYARERFAHAKALYLAPKLRAAGRPVAVWGAGQTGRAFARALEAHAIRAALFIDIDPRKIGRTARGAPIRAPSELRQGDHTVLVALGERGARAIVRARLTAAGFAEGPDFVCVA